MLGITIGDLLVQCVYCWKGGEVNLEPLGLIYYSISFIHVTDFVAKWVFWGYSGFSLVSNLLCWFFFVFFYVVLYKLCVYINSYHLKYFNFEKVIGFMRVVYLLIIFFSLYIMFIILFLLFNNIYFLVAVFFNVLAWSTTSGWLVFGVVWLTLSLLLFFFFRTLLRFVWLGEDSIVLQKCIYYLFEMYLVRQDADIFEFKLDFYLYDSFDQNLIEIDKKIEREMWFTMVPGSEFVDLWGRYYIKKIVQYIKNKFRLFYKNYISSTVQDLINEMFKYWD